MKTLNMKVLAVLGGSLLAAATLQANLVLDPGFESQIQPSAVGDVTTSPWTRTPDQSVIVTTSSGWVHTGSEGVAFASGYNSDLLTQTLTTTPGQTYSISFWLKGVGSPNIFSVLWGGSTLSTLGPPVQTVGSDWEQFTLSATAGAGTSTVLGFQVVPGDPNGTYTPALDDINVEASAPVPEPTTCIAGALLLIPFGLSVLRKKRTA